MRSRIFKKCHVGAFIFIKKGKFMWYSITISVLLIVCLILYFVFSKKLKMPTVATEIMISKYNKKICKLEKFCKLNKLDFDKTKVSSSLIEDKLNVENLLSNTETIKAIASNYEDIEDIYVSSEKMEAQEKINKLKNIAPIKIFADELKCDPGVRDVFETFNVSFTKLDFEVQKYFGSQNCVNIGNEKLIFLENEQIVVVNDKNIFECKSGNGKIEILKKVKSGGLPSEENIFVLKIFFNGAELFTKEVLVESKNVENFLLNNKYFKNANV